MTGIEKKIETHISNGKIGKNLEDTFLLMIEVG
jgi:hypothetical protein